MIPNHLDRHLGWHCGWPKLLVFAPVMLALSFSCHGRGESDLQRHRNLGKAYMENGKVEEAISEFQTCFRISASAEDHVRLGKAYFLAKRHEDAIRTFLEARSFLPDRPDIAYNLGILYKRMGKVTESIEELERFTALDAESPEGWYNLGVLYTQLERTAAAKRCFERTLSIDPFHAPSHYRLYAIARMEGRSEEAAHQLAVFQDLKERIPNENLSSDALELSPQFEIDLPPPGPTGSQGKARAEPGRIGRGESVASKYEDITHTSGLDRFSSGVIDAEFLDADQDGNPDLVLLTAEGGDSFSVVLARNDATGVFSETVSNSLGGIAVSRIVHCNHSSIIRFIEDF